ncbi:MAG: HD-GYP domain-containing protein [Lachnospiraceae bacterium]|jgi:putative nucleotidyltransferase with HDIG domain|nr:HD-GYP domain-containing protein [Lachnospiraceae bacterium]
MRYMPMAKVETGMALGQDIYNGEGRLILGRHVILNNDNLQELLSLGFPGIYIDDEFTEDLMVTEVIRPEVKREALKMVHDLFLDNKNLPMEQHNLQEVVIDVMEEVLNNGDVMCNMLDIKTYDDYVYFHSVNVAVLSTMIGAACNMNKEELDILTTAALLHDVGKRFVEEDVLNVKRALTEEERIMIVQHPKLGYDFLVENFDFLPEVYDSVLEHHEWYNGCGYPLRRSGSEIPIYARIIKLADVYDALTSKLPYHEAVPPSEAVEYIMANAGAEFDPELVDVFMRKIAVYPEGCEVRLSDGRTAVVMENYKEFILRPKVKVIPTGEIINLKSDNEARSLTILELNV